MLKGSLNAMFAIALLSSLTGTALAFDLEKGRSLYAANCASCHGMTGINIMLDAPSLTQSESLLKPDSYLFEVISNGKNAMPLYKGTLNEQDIFDLIAYIRSFN
jgi:cytochrome c6